MMFLGFSGPAGSSCSTANDCDGILICKGGYCGGDVGDFCSTDIDCGGALTCSNNECGSPSGSSSSSSSSSGSKPSSSSSSSDSWLTAIAKGAAQAVLPSTGKPVVKAATPTPWYLTPFGLVAIAVGIGGGAYLLMKK
jgi:hypothetical protein